MKDDVFDQDRKKYFNPQPYYVLAAKEESETFTIRVRPEDIRQRPVAFGPFILDTLRKKGVDLQRDVLARYKDLCDSLDESQDVDLMKPYEGVRDKVNDPENTTEYASLVAELDTLRGHVQKMFWKYVKEVGALGGQNKNLSSDERAKASRGISRRALVQDLITEFWSSKLKSSEVLLNAEEHLAWYAYD